MNWLSVNESALSFVFTDLFFFTIYLFILTFLPLKTFNILIYSTHAYQINAQAQAQNSVRMQLKKIMVLKS